MEPEIHDQFYMDIALPLGAIYQVQKLGDRDDFLSAWS